MRTVAPEIARPGDLARVVDRADAPDTRPDAACVLLDSAIQIDQDAGAIDELRRIGFPDDVAAIVDPRRERIVDVVPVLATAAR